MPWSATGTTSVTVLHPLTYLADVHLWFRHQCWAEAIKHRCEPLHENSGHAVTAIIQAAIATIGAGRVQWWTMRQKPKAYLETSVISYATSRLSRQLMVAAQQQYTTEWLEKVATRFDCFVSELVVEEAMQGDPGAAARRQQRLVEFAVLTIDPTARQWQMNS